MSQPPDHSGHHEPPGRYPPPGYPAPPPGGGGSAYGYPASSAGIGSGLPGSAVAPLNTSAVVLLVVSAVAALATGLIGIPSAVIAILALRAGRTDPAGSRRTTRAGWIVFAVNAVIGLGLLVALFWWLRLP